MLPIRKFEKILLILILLVFSVVPVKAQEDRPPCTYPVEKEVLQNIDEWGGMKFGLFIHWGPYSQSGVVESWTLCPEDRYWITRPEDISYT